MDINNIPNDLWYILIRNMFYMLFYQQSKLQDRFYIFFYQILNLIITEFKYYKLKFINYLNFLLLRIIEYILKIFKNI